MALIIPYRGKTPRLAPDVFIADNAVLVGDIEIGPGSSIWYGVTIRADGAPVRIGARVNIQDNSVVHVDVDAPVAIADDVSVGHRAIVHGSTVGAGSLIGMGAILLSRSVVGAGAIVAAGSLVVEGGVVADGELVMGAPARPRRTLSADEIHAAGYPARHYVSLSREYLAAQAERAKAGH